MSSDKKHIPDDISHTCYSWNCSDTPELPSCDDDPVLNEVFCSYGVQYQIEAMELMKEKISEDI